MGKCDYDSDRPCKDTQPSGQCDTPRGIDRAPVTGAAVPFVFKQSGSPGCQSRRGPDGGGGDDDGGVGVSSANTNPVFPHLTSYFLLLKSQKGHGAAVKTASRMYRVQGHPERVSEQTPLSLSRRAIIKTCSDGNCGLLQSQICIVLLS